jgi:XTP/dITP diphosphohydrolase
MAATEQEELSMAKKLAPRIVLASGNPGKAREIAQLLAEYRVEVLPQSAFNVPEAEETGLTFVENAILKARNAAAHSGLPAMADDSGLEVDALNGAPGIYSARYAGSGCSDADNNAKLLEALQDIPEAERSARFQCVLVYLTHAEDPTPLIVQGSWEGRILSAPRGAGGFGYDPLFFVPDLGMSSAELPADTKNRLSHRGQALRALLEAFDQAGG